MILNLKENIQKDEKIKTEWSDYEICHSGSEGRKERRKEGSKQYTLESSKLFADIKR